MRITRVYTRVGDGGDTYLGGGQKVPKDSLRIEAYGTVDELNSVLGVALTCGLDGGIAPMLLRVQNDLFHLGSDLCVLEEDKKRIKIPQIEKRHVDSLEAEMDRLQADLKPLEEFILPGGSPGAAHLHVARTVCRRAERLVVALGRKEPVGPFTVMYLNRLSDYLFVAARHENRTKGAGDVQWQKGI
ncbi:MAG TPA: cob(I)yrinic acid a,c-diamide adenosyltransferase [Planctomycetota bacterium]|nr:cob(I)yrinic acid a,c-diamide adenosyltransferase [Planctomycetota bacterium]